MKNFLTKISIAIVILLLACTSAIAQQKKPVQGYDPTTEKNVAAKLAEAKKIIDDNAREVDEEAKKQHLKSIPKDSKLNFIPLFNEVPYPIAGLSDARNVDAESKYNPYLQRMETERQQFAAIAVKKNKYNEVYQQEGQAGLERRAKEQSDKNPVVQQMGGADKMMQMSEEERKAAATQVANNIKQNPSSLYAGNSQMAGFAQKYQSDPAFAARFNKMSQAEKEAEMRKFMAENQANNQVAFDAAKHESESSQIKNNKSQAQQKIDFDLLMQRTTQRLGAASDRQIKIGEKIDETIAELKQKISDRFGPLYAAVPTVALGEYGHDKDPKQMTGLNIQEAKSRNIVDVHEAALRCEAWKILKIDYQNAIGELNDFLANYKWGSDTGELFGTYHEDMIAAAADGPYNMLIELTKEAKQQTINNQKKQILFEEAISKK